MSIMLSQFQLILKSLAEQNTEDPKFWTKTNIIQSKKQLIEQIQRIPIESIVDLKILFVHTLDTSILLDLLSNFCENIWKFDFLHLFSLINIFGAWTFLDIMWYDAWQQVIGEPIKLISSEIRFTIHCQYKLSRIFQNAISKDWKGGFPNYHNKITEPGYFNDFRRYRYEGRLVKPPRSGLEAMKDVYVKNYRDGWLSPCKYQVYHLYAFQKISECYLNVLSHPTVSFLLWILIIFALFFSSLVYFVFKIFFIKINKKIKNIKITDKDDFSDKKNE